MRDQVCAGVVNAFELGRIMLGGAEVPGAVAVVLRGDRVSAAVRGQGR